MKQIDLIIVQAHRGYYISMSGHMPNPKFRNVVTETIETYGEAFSMTSRLAHVIGLLGNTVKCYNENSVEEKAKQYCDYMAFECFETLKDE